MTDFFLNIVNMSISASWIVLAVLLLRLLLKRAPKWITVLLWGIVAIRLICPLSLESVMSLIPSTETISPDIMMEHKPSINTGIPIVNDVVNPVIEESFSPEPLTSVNPLQILIPVLSVVWMVGIAVMLVYTVISYWRVKSKIGTAILLRDNIFQSESVVSPFVLGIIKPRIYLPFHMTEQDMEHVIAHENAHIRRKDHWWKPFGFLVLTLHWFNPFIWLGYVLLCRDIELACDEKVVKEFDHQQKADYAQALLTCSVNRRVIAACPLAFGELGVKDRVKSVLNYKKPAFWILGSYTPLV
jgi:beta-lactamase regulating signal transducer with metallopeptidase domain